MALSIAKKPIIVFVFLLARLPARAQDITGDWQGTLKSGAVELRFVLHVNRNSNGEMSAALDSVDQGANGIQITAIAVQDSELRFTVASVKASYRGEISTDQTEIVGTWSQPEPLPLVFTRLRSPKEEHTIDGTWVGIWVTGVLESRMVFHISTLDDRPTATLESPEESAKKIPATSVKYSGHSLTLELKQIDSRFEAMISKNFKTISGTWTHSGISSPLILKRIEDTTDAEFRRPQDPIKPYPYSEFDISYRNVRAGITLAATLTVPQGKGPFPAVVLITGSGPQDRDETLMGHRPFLVLSDYLTRRGIAVLRADDRGVGRSTGDFFQATTADFATDVEAGLAYLETRPEIDKHRIGLVGHSEGGMIAPMIAARNSHVAFIVLMAGPGVPGEDVLLTQNRLITEASGTRHDLAEKDTVELRELLEMVKQSTDNLALSASIHKKLAATVPEAQMDREIQQLGSPWFRYFLNYDPADTLRQVRCPVLAIDGEKDLQVPPGQNLPAIRKALKDGRNKDFEVAELPGLNHLFQTANTGLPSEYGEIEETISPLALDTIARWISQRKRAR